MAPYLLLILAICAADQLTKLWAMNFIFDHAAASGIAGAALPLDRVLLGYVVDFIDVRIFGSLWRWVFNVADAAVCVGAALLVIYCLVSYKKEKKETAK